jgi:hypothetical protein
MRKYLITGSNGLVGSSLKKILGDGHVYHTKDEVDLTDSKKTLDYITYHVKNNGVDSIINCSAKVGGVQANMKNNKGFFIENFMINNNVIESSFKNEIPNFVNLLSTCIFPDKNITFPLTPNQIEPTPSIFRQFNIKDLGRDPKTFNINDFWEYEFEVTEDKIEETGSTLPIFMSKYDYIRLGGWDENYEAGMVADWDFFLKCSMSNLKMIRTWNCHFYHFASVSFNGEKRQQAEQAGHEYAKYKWGSHIYHHPDTNQKFIL